MKDVNGLINYEFIILEYGGEYLTHSTPAKHTSLS